MAKRTRDAGRLAGRTVATLVAVCAIVSALPLRAGAATNLEKLGTLPINTGEGVVTDAATRRIIAIGGGPDVLKLTAFDGDRLTRGRTITFDPYRPQYGLEGRPRVFALDAQARRIYVIAFASREQLAAGVDPSLLSIDLDKMQLVSKTSLLAAFPPGIRVLGLRPHAGRIVLVGQALPGAEADLLGRTEVPRVAGVVVAEVDPASGMPSWGPVAVRGCQTAITNQSPADPGITDTALFVGCSTAQASASTPLPGLQAVAMIDRATPSNQQLHVLPGGYGTGDTYFDSAARRLLLIGSAPASPAQAAWVFDLDHQVFVGQVASGDVNVLGAGLDPSTGRIYVGVDGALLISSSRGVEIPQAARFDVATNSGAIRPVPFNASVIVPVRGPASTYVYTVFRDPLPAGAFAPGEPVNFAALDDTTSESPEFTGESQAFGLRVHVIGGVNAQLQNVFQLKGGYWTEVGRNTGLKDGDRDLYLARIMRAHLSQDEASAQAIAARRDSNSESDYGTIGKAAPETLPAWPYDEAGCRDFGGGSTPEQAEGAATTCRLLAGSVEADAVYGDGGIPGVLSVVSALSETALTRSASGAVSVRTRAEARGVIVGENVHIGAVRSEAIAGATGARGGGAGEYIRSFHGVTAGDYRCDMICDVPATLAAISEALGSQFRVELPAADELTTPGGSHGHAVRHPWEHQEDVVINNQDPTELQVPALRVTYIADKALASRVIIELAATKADATSLRIASLRPPGPEPVAPIPAHVPSVAPPFSPPPPAPPIPAPTFTERLVRTIGHGWRVLAAGGVADIARSIALWSLLAAPVFFATRRRWLRRLPGESL